MKLDIPIDDDALKEKGIPADGRYFAEMIVSNLYHLGVLSSKEACDALHTNRRQFEELLPKFDLAIMPDTAEDIENEINQ